MPPAPGELRCVQAFVNTLDLETGEDELEDGVALGRWLDAWGLLPEAAELGGDELRAAKELREGLRRLLTAHGAEPADPQGGTRSDPLDRALGGLPLRLRLTSSGGLALRAVDDGWPRAAAKLLTIALRAMVEGHWTRLKACQRDDCRWVFYDRSRNRSGRWCSMSGCGNRMKARAYRRRQADDG